MKTPCRQVIPNDYGQKSMLEQIANLLEKDRTTQFKIERERWDKNKTLNLIDVTKKKLRG